MRAVFADTCYWIALLNPKDQTHEVAIRVSKGLADCRILTTEEVLTELLNYFGERGSYFRSASSKLVQRMQVDRSIHILPVEEATAMQHAYEPTLYEQLEALPEGLTGEILNGQLHTQPRPAGPHALTESNLQIEIGGPFGKGRGGPGGWLILAVPEIHFVTDQEVVVPDLAGWLRERMPHIPQGHRFEVVPDWVCEILSPSTASKDREIKMPIYAHYCVSYAWLIDPMRRSLEAYDLEDGEWRLLAEASGNDAIAVAPFDALKLDLSNLWN